MWRPTEKEIYDWLKKKQIEFIVRENKNPNRSAEDWLQDHIYSDLHEIFFCEFPIILSEWLLRLCENNGTWRIDGPREWTFELIKQLKEVSIPISCTIYFWIDSILRGYIIEFGIDCTKSYSTAEREFLQGTRAKYLRKLIVWIKMALRDHGTLHMRNDS